MEKRGIKILGFLLLIVMFAMCSKDDDIHKDNKPEKEKEYVPPKYKGVDYKLAEKTKVITQEEFNRIEKHDATNQVFTYKNGTDSKKIPKVGSQIVINKVNKLFPYGLLAKVTKVTNEGGATKVSYKHIPIEKAFKKLSIDTSEIKLKVGEIKVLDKKHKTIKANVKTGTDGKSIHLNIPEIAVPIGSTTVKTKFKTVFTWNNFQIGIDDYSLKKFNLEIEQATDINLDLELALEKEKEVKIGLVDIYLPPVVIGVVVIGPSIEIDLVVKAKGGVTLTSQVRYTQSNISKLNYNGSKWSASNQNVPITTNKDGSPYTFNSKIDINGSVLGGVSLGVDLGLYYKALYVALEAGAGIQASASVNFDFSKVENYNSWYNSLKTSKLATDIVYGLDANVKHLFTEEPLATMNVASATEPIWEGYFLPHFENIVASAPAENGATLELKVTNSLALETELKAKIFEVDKNDHINIKKPVAVVDFGTHTILGKKEKEKIYRKAVKGLKEDTKYRAIPYFTVTSVGLDLLLDQYATDFKTSRSIPHKADFKRILMDIYNSATNKAELKEQYNWDIDKDITTWKGIYFFKNKEGKTEMFISHVPIKGSFLEINNHTEGIKDIAWTAQVWSFVGISNSITIKDKNFKGFIIDKEDADKNDYASPKLDSSLRRFIVNSPNATLSLDGIFGQAAFDLALEYMDISNCKTLYDSFNIHPVYAPNLRTLILKNVQNLKSISFGDFKYAKLSKMKIENIDLTGVKDFEYIEFENIDLQNDFPTIKSSHLIDAYLEDSYNYSTKKLTIRNVKNVDIEAEADEILITEVSGNIRAYKMKNLTVTNCESTQLEAGIQEELVVRDCDKLEKIEAASTKATITKCKTLTQLSLSGSLKDLNLKGDFNKLEDLNLSGNQLTQLNLNNRFDALKTLKVSYNQLTQLNLNGHFNALKTLNISNNQLTQFNLDPEKFPALMNLYCRENKMLGEIPTLIKYIKSSGGVVEYDIRYYYDCVYNEEKEKYEPKNIVDNNVGFWYPGEPCCDCGVDH